MEGAESRVGFIPFLLPAHVSHTLWVHRDPMDRGWATLTPWCPTGHISRVQLGIGASSALGSSVLPAGGRGSMAGV